LEVFFPDRNIIEFHLLYIGLDDRGNGYSKTFFETMENYSKKYTDKQTLVLSVALEHSKNCSIDLVENYEKRGFSKTHISYNYKGINNDDLTDHVPIGKPLPTGSEFKKIGYLMCKKIRK